MTAEPVLTRRADGYITVEWPHPCPHQHLVNHELLVQMIDQFNRCVMGHIDVPTCEVVR
jgi:hypothetical protein